MGRLIDLDTVPHRRVRFKTSNDSSSMANELDVVFYEDLVQAPTIEAVPVVRCKDCVYAKPFDKRWPDLIWCDIYKTYKEKDWFCADAERRESEKDDDE